MAVEVRVNEQGMLGEQGEVVVVVDAGRACTPQCAGRDVQRTAPAGRTALNTTCWP
jgi:hypothetical protein